MEDNEILDKGIILPKIPSIDNAKEIIKLRRAFKEQFNKVKNGRYAIIGLIVYVGIGGIYEIITTNFDIYVTGFNLSVLAVLIGVYFYSLKEPYYAFIATLIGLVTLIGITGILDPIYIIKGLLWKGIIIYFLVVAMTPSKKIKSTILSLLTYGIDLSSSKDQK